MKVITVREFDRIVQNDAPIAGQISLPPEDFGRLRSFLMECRVGEGEDAPRLIDFSYKGRTPTFTIQNYVGVIEIQKRFQIEILPKIDLGSDADIGKTKKIFARMLRSLKDLRGRCFSESDLGTDRMNLYDLFAKMYIDEARWLAKSGLKSSYISVEDRLRCMKGRLNVYDQIRSNAAHKERLNVIYDEYSVDRPENRIVKTTLLKLRGITSSVANQKAIAGLLPSFELVSQTFDPDKEFSKIAIDRSNREYEPLMGWSKIFLRNRSFTTFSGASRARALLFPMEKVFESYVAGQLRKSASGTGWSIKAQAAERYLLDAPTKEFELRPDVIARKGSRTVVLDTKWKELNDGRPRHGISQADIYQMYVYSKKYSAPDIWLLYPRNPSMHGYESYSDPAHCIRYESGDGTTIHVFFVDLEHIGPSMDTLVGLL